jgi:hypothetical protein
MRCWFDAVATQWKSLTCTLGVTLNLGILDVGPIKIEGIPSGGSVGQMDTEANINTHWNMVEALYSRREVINGFIKGKGRRGATVGNNML